MGKERSGYHVGRRHDGGTAASGGGMTAQAAETESSDTVSTQKAVTSDAASLLFYGEAYYIGSYINNDRASGTTIS